MQRLLRTLKANLSARETWFCVLALSALSLVISLIVRFTLVFFCDALTVLSVLWIVLSFRNGFKKTSFADREKGMLTLSRWMLHAVADHEPSDDEDDDDEHSNVMLTSGLICLFISVALAAALLFCS